MDTNRLEQQRRGFLFKKTVLWIAAISSFLPPFMGSALNIALPNIGREFTLSAVMVGWVNSIYLLTTAVSLIPIGRIADIFGRKRVFFCGVVIYTIVCLLCALAPSASFLILFRGLLGVGAAMLFGPSTAILTSVFPLEERGRVLGINVAAVYLGLSGGPILGGLMTEYLGWRSIFIANIPVGIWIGIVVFREFKEEWAPARGEPIDLPGIGIYCLALSTFMFGLSRLPSGSGLGFTLFGLIVLIAFIGLERRVKFPIIDLGLFVHNRLFAYSNLAALIHYSATFVVGFLLSLFFQIVGGHSPAQTGLIMITQPLVQTVFSPLAGRLSDHLEPRVIASCGMAVTCLGLIALVLIPPDTGLPVLIAILFLLGFAFALFSSPNTNAIMSSVDKSQYGVASATLATTRQIGQMLSMTIAMLVFSLFIGSAPLSQQGTPGFLLSMKAILMILVGLCVAGIFASLARGNRRP